MIKQSSPVRDYLGQETKQQQDSSLSCCRFFHFSVLAVFFQTIVELPALTP